MNSSKLYRGIGLALTGLLMVGVTSVASANDHQIVICHSDGPDSYTNPPVPKHQVAGDDGHGSFEDGVHPNDIVPPFPAGSQGANSWAEYFGKNWTTEGQAIYNNDCVNPNVSATGTLTLAKVVDGDSGAAPATDWTLSASGATPISGVTGNAAVTNAVVDQGNYDLSESGPTTNYNASAWNCGNAAMVDADTVTVAADPVTCTITNTYTAPTSGDPTGSIEITKYVCPAGTTVNRTDNGVGGSVPEGCVLQTGANFGYVHGTQTDANAPYPELSEPITEAGATSGGILTISNLLATGRYLIVESDGAGNKLPHEDVLGLYCEGDGDTNPNNNDNQELTLVPENGTAHCVAYNEGEVPTNDSVTLHAQKIICDDESDLPNWGAGNVVGTIGATTAQDWLDEVGTNLGCSLTGWDFEWSYRNEAGDPDDNTPGSAGAGWTAFTAGTAVVDVSKNTQLGVREIFQSGYVPFTGQNTNQDVSAEIYCGTDVLHYDNWEWIDAVAGEEYYCVAWNVPIEPPIVCEPDIELIANGSFESPNVTHGTGWDIFPSGTPLLEWIVEWAGAFVGAPEVANLELHRGVNGWLSASGAQHTELDTDWNGHAPGPNGEQASVSIYQEIPTALGEEYSLTYKFSPRPGTSAGQNVLEVLVDGVVVGTHSAAGGAQTSWTSHNYSFSGTGAATKIEFRDAGTPNAEGTFLDDVSLMCQRKPEDPKEADVTICKYDEQDNELPGWTLMLLGDHIEQVVVNPDGNDYDSSGLPLGPYVVIANGEYTYRPGTVGAEYSDAAYSKRHPSDAVYGGPFVPWVRENDFPVPHTGWLGIMMNDVFTDWGSTFNPLHEYALGTTTSGVQSFKILDDVYSDNTGNLTADIYEGWMDVTGENGCVVFEDVPYGRYTIDEIMQEGWENISGLGEWEIDEATETFTVVNGGPETAQITINKILKDEEGNANEAFFFDLSWLETELTLSANDDPVMYTVPVGTHTIREKKDPNDDYYVSSMECTTGDAEIKPEEGRMVIDSENDEIEITLEAGEDVTCTFENTYDPDSNGETDPQIIVRKVTIPDTEQNFEFDVSWDNENFFLGNGDDESSNLESLLPEGNPFSVSEVNIPSGWTLTSAVCDSNMEEGTSTPDVIQLEDEEIVTCTFTNEQVEITTTSGGGGNGNRSSSSSRRGGSSSSGGEVLGEQISLVPLGAPNTGAGGLLMCLN